MKAILFDLDGTLLDTARDFAYAINLILARSRKPALDFNLFRKEVHGESRRMISFAFNIEESDPKFEAIRENFLRTYNKNSTRHTIFFPGVKLVLETLDAKKIPWGIVTSKPTWLTKSVLKHFELDKRAKCIVMGDTLEKIKPDPTPLLYACKKMLVAPEDTIYVGDLKTDIIAAKAAGMKSIAVTYGYHPPGTNFQEWGADFIAHTPLEILNCLAT